MSHYRDLNRELVEQVQTMRKTMKLYCDEIVLLKADLMQKYESEVLLRNQCYNWALNNFVQLVEYVQPDSDILAILKERVNTEEISCGTNEGRERARSPNAHRRSSLLTREFQRSSSVMQLRRSVSNTSPLRRSYSNRSDGNGDEELQDMELENVNVADNEARLTYRPTDVGNIIFEDSDEAAEEDQDVESIYESVEEVSDTISEQRSALSDITNSLKSTKKTSSRRQNIQVKELNNRKVRPKRTKKKNLSDKDNSADEYSTSREDSDLDIRGKRNTPRRTSLTDKNMEEESLQEPRRYSNNRCNFDSNKIFPWNQNHDQISNGEVTMSSTTFGLTNMTGNFNDAACSTPNSRQNSLEAASPTIQIQTVSNIQLSSSNTSSTRPSRRCKPKNLSEPQLGTKLRNNNATKKSKPKSKTKK